jgi:hypothetical protein
MRIIQGNCLQICSDYSSCRTGSAHFEVMFEPSIFLGASSFRQSGVYISARTSPNTHESGSWSIKSIDNSKTRTLRLLRIPWNPEVAPHENNIATLTLHLPGTQNDFVTRFYRVFFFTGSSGLTPACSLCQPSTVPHV